MRDVDQSPIELGTQSVHPGVLLERRPGQVISLGRDLEGVVAGAEDFPALAVRQCELADADHAESLGRCLGERPQSPHQAAERQTAAR